MIGINQTLQIQVNCLCQTVMAALCPTSDQEAKSMINPTLGTTEMRDYAAKTDGLVVTTKASATVLTYHQPSTILQSP